MYELYRLALVQHYEATQGRHDADIKIQLKDCQDKSRAKVETQLRVLRAQNDKFVCVINLYHTMVVRPPVLRWNIPQSLMKFYQVKT